MDRLFRLRVIAGPADIDHGAGQVGRVDLDLRDFLPGEILAHRDRRETRRAAHVAEHAAAFVARDRDDAAERVENAVNIAGAFRHDDEPVILTVLGQGHAETVDDGPARRRDQTHRDAVALGQDGIAIGLDDLQVIHPPGQHAEHAELDAGENGRAPGEELAPLSIIDHRAPPVRFVSGSAVAPASGSRQCPEKAPRSGSAGREAAEPAWAGSRAVTRRSR